ncbi:MAG: beta-propeller domain-containing protein, partial [Clostridia bacterium]|nr:beta-propeller domain-containing protein [Clostridia bacterium]
DTAQQDETESAVPETEPEEITIVLGEDPAETDETETEIPIQPPAEENPGTDESDEPDGGTVTMIIPASYAEINRALREADWYGVSYEEALELEIVETGAPIAVPQTESEIIYEAEEQTGNDGGRVYTADEMYSLTNTQLDDVDEGDIVKTDGEYIYILKNSEELVILSADGDDTKVLSRTTVAVDYEYCGWEPDGNVFLDELENEAAKELYISGDRLGIVRTYYNWLREPDRDENRTYLDIFDVSDPASPGYITTLGQDGLYNTSRMIGDTVWLITRKGISIDDIADPDTAKNYIPMLRGRDSDELIETGCIVYPEEIAWKAYTVISSCDLSTGKRGASKAVLGTYGGTVYMNGDHVYLADRERYEILSEPYQADAYTAVDTTTGQRTHILRLDLGDEIRTTAAVTVPGALLSQFSMDEHNGHLRVVTTLNENTRTQLEHPSLGITNNLWKSGTSGNALYILDETLEITGKIEDIAPDEQVKSVRFTGDTGYFVTFRRIDPLFAVDLSRPDAPVIMSELKIPGFSSYLHPYADGLLFGLGYDADAETGSTTGLKLSMFDTSDPYDVTETHKLTPAYGWSSALGNHKAILVSASRSLIGFPADNGYAVFGYDPDTGFHEKAFLALNNGSWDGTSRGMYIGDTLYIVMQTGCTVLDMAGFRILTQVEY